MHQKKKSFVTRICDSRLARIAGLVSDLLGISKWLVLVLGIVLLPRPHKQPVVAGRTAAAPSRPAVPAGTSVVTTKSGVAPTMPPTVFQTSHGAQSPNVSGVQHDVHIQYYSSAPAAPEGESVMAPVFPTRGVATIQISQGTQSPNVSTVSGNVDIRYDSPVPGRSDKPAGEKQQ